MRLFEESTAGFLGLTSNVLRELGKESGLGLSLWLEGWMRVGVPLCGQVLMWFASPPAPKVSN